MVEVALRWPTMDETYLEVLGSLGDLAGWRDGFTLVLVNLKGTGGAGLCENRLIQTDLSQ